MVILPRTGFDFNEFYREHSILGEPQVFIQFCVSHPVICEGCNKGFKEHKCIYPITSEYGLRDVLKNHTTYTVPCTCGTCNPVYNEVRLMLELDKVEL